MIQQETINEILNRADIVDVVSQFVNLKKNGANYTACCPFHQEKTPSFVVSPGRQMWHCFGQCQTGGNVISFIMKHEAKTFPEAVKWLAERYGIDYLEEEEDVHAREERMRREALLGINHRVQQFYASLLTPEKSPTAWGYATRRFGETYVKEYGIGVAPDGWHTLRDWADQRGENPELLRELGLLKRKEDTGTVYDTYRNRLMIPIRDRLGHVTGFTARSLGDEDDVAKYINSQESMVYHKRSSIFGIDEAYKAALKEEVMYLVEGAPDALKLHAIGVNNTVATLGGNWTREQMRELRKIVPEVCFLPDADPVPQGKRYGTGHAYVMKAGETAMDCGLNVSVREIPQGPGNTKQDPGSYCTSLAKFHALESVEFVEWVAEKIFDKGDTTTQRQKNIQQIAGLVSYVKDEMRRSMILPKLNKYYKGKGLWENAVNTARRLRSQEENKKAGKVDLRQYGFWEQNGGYYGMTEKDTEVQWCNFTMKPLFLIQDADDAKRLYLIKGENGREKLAEMDIEEMVSIVKFRNKMESLGNFVWKATERELIKMKSYLYDHTEEASRVKLLGWQPQGFYCFGNGAWNDGEFVKADDYGIIRLGEKGTWYVPAASRLFAGEKQKFEYERKFVYLGLSSIRMDVYLKKFVDVFGDNGKVGICYWLASLFHDIVCSYTRTFPLLDLFGPKGSGKSELGAALMAFFVADNKAPNLRNSTSTSLNDAVAFASNALIHLDEYKNDIRPDKLEFLKGLYDGVGRTKMAGSGFDRRIMTAVNSGVIISGQEMPTGDIALFHRCVFLTFPRSEFTVEERARFADLREIQKPGLSHLTLEVLKYRKLFESNFYTTYQAVQDEINEALGKELVETRILENWAKVLAAYKTLKNKIVFPFSYEEMFGIVMDGIRRQNKESGINNELAEFWNIVSFLRDNGEIFDGADFRIDVSGVLKTDMADRQFAEPKQILLLNKARVFMLYKKNAAAVDGNILPEGTLLYYLKNSEYYFGMKASVRFKKIVRGIQEAKTVYGKVEPLYVITRAMAFDYDIIRQKYGIELVASTEPENPKSEKTNTPGTDRKPEDGGLPF